MTLSPKTGSRCCGFAVNESDLTRNIYMSTCRSKILQMCCAALSPTYSCSMYMHARMYATKNASGVLSLHSNFCLRKKIPRICNTVKANLYWRTHLIELIFMQWLGFLLQMICSHRSKCLNQGWTVTRAMSRLTQTHKTESKFIRADRDRQCMVGR